MRNLVKGAYNFAIRVLPPRMAIRLMYFRRLGLFPSFSNPMGFNERIQIRKLTDRNPLGAVPDN